MTTSARYKPPGDRGVRYGHWVVLVAFWVAMASVCVAAVVVVIVQETGTAAPSCPPTRFCPGPTPVLPVSGLATWTSHDRGVGLTYPVDVFALDDQTQDTLRLSLRVPRPAGVEATVSVSARPARDGLPEAILRQQRSELGASILGLTEDQDPETIIPPPRIGNIVGVGGSYRGTADTPQGPAQPAIAILDIAGDGHTTVAVSYVITGTDDASQIRLMRRYLSPILTSFTWES